MSLFQILIICTKFSTKKRQLKVTFFKFAINHLYHNVCSLKIDPAHLDRKKWAKNWLGNVLTNQISPTVSVRQFLCKQGSLGY
jgi:hypothetical protein